MPCALTAKSGALRLLVMPKTVIEKLLKLGRLVIYGQGTHF
jgi:hypothetical protein